MRSYVEKSDVVKINIDEQIFDDMLRSPEFVSEFKNMSDVMKQV